MQKKLVLRLSSLGDLVLASVVLELQPSVDWVVGSQYASLLKDHPKIGRLHVFDRRFGMRSWFHFSRVLWEQEYEVIFDLHRTLRTRLLKGFFYFFFIKSALEGKWKAFPKWKTISKQRIRVYGYLLFKNAWPRKYRPSPWREQYARFLGGTGAEKPNFDFLLKAGKKYSIPSKPYFCVMPSSRWKGKNWPVAYYVQVIQSLPFFPVILGQQADTPSLELEKALQFHRIPHLSGVGKWSLEETAWALKQARMYFGNDTGLFHLAEALGTPAFVIFGPTTGGLGFNPWRSESRILEVSLQCRPCSKNGAWCPRFWEPYACLHRLSPEKVLYQWEKK